MQPIPYSKLSDLEPIGQGGYAYVYKAKHPRFGTVVYKELFAKKLGNRYSKAVLVQCDCVQCDQVVIHSINRNVITFAA